MPQVCSAHGGFDKPGKRANSNSTNVQNFFAYFEEKEVTCTESISYCYGTIYFSSRSSLKIPMKDKARQLTPRSLIRKMVIAARQRKTRHGVRTGIDVTTSVVVSSPS